MDNERLEYLLNLHFNQMLEGAELRELEQILLESRDARGKFWEMAKVNAALWQWGQEGWGQSQFATDSAGCVIVGEEPFESDVVPFEPKMPTRSRPPKRRISSSAWVSMSAAAALLIGFFVWMFLPQSPSPRPGVAVMGASSDAVWMSGASAPRKGATLTSGWLRLQSGAAQVEFLSGARVLLEGPLEFKLVTENSGELSYGKLLAVVPEPAHGFTVNTKDLTIVDYGTEFGCSVEADGVAEVHVFDGEVGVKSTAVEASKEVALKANEAVRLEAEELLPIEPNAESFINEREFIRLTEEGAAAQYRGWQQFSQYFKQRPDLLAYLDFEQQGQDAWSLPNLATNAGGGAAVIVGAKSVEGRWLRKSALDFKNSSDRVRLTVPGEFENLTLFAWVQVNSTPNRFNCLVMAENRELLGELQWYVYSTDTLGVGVRNAPRGHGDQWWHAHTTQKVTEDTVDGWAFVATVFDRQAGELRHYINGEFSGSEVLGYEHPLLLGTLEVGNWGASAVGSSESFNFTGRIDELAILSSVLDENEIRTIYEIGCPTLP